MLDLQLLKLFDYICTIELNLLCLCLMIERPYQVILLFSEKYSHSYLEATFRSAFNLH